MAPYNRKNYVKLSNKNSVSFKRYKLEKWEKNLSHQRENYIKYIVKEHIKSGMILICDFSFLQYKITLF